MQTPQTGELSPNFREMSSQCHRAKLLQLDQTVVSLLVVWLVLEARITNTITKVHKKQEISKFTKMQLDLEIDKQIQIWLEYLFNSRMEA